MEKRRCEWANSSKELAAYHDREYGFRIRDDIKYFERLVLEIFQAGLSWSTILKKREAFRKAFDGFDPRKVARYGEKKVKRLLSDPSIIRNRLKISAAIKNAKEFMRIIDEHGSFDRFVRRLPIGQREEVLRTFKERFFFMGPLIVEEFMMSTGLWEVRHQPGCFLYRKMPAKKP